MTFYVGATMTNKRDMSFSRYPKLIGVMKFVKNKHGLFDKVWRVSKDNKECKKANERKSRKQHEYCRLTAYLPSSACTMLGLM